MFPGISSSGNKSDETGVTVFYGYYWSNDYSLFTYKMPKIAHLVKMYLTISARTIQLTKHTEKNTVIFAPLAVFMTCLSPLVFSR